MSDATCSVEGCGKPVFVKSRGLCQTCYWRWWRNGDPEILKKFQPSRGATIEERFWPSVDKDGPVPRYAPHLGPCWIWTGKLNKGGYGTFNVGRKHPGAHAVSYGLLVGKVPDSLELDHLCRVRCCVNPAHLEPVTGAENMRRAMEARKSCDKGHPFDEANTRWYRGHRQCRTCDRDSARVRRASPREGTRHVKLTVKLSEADAALIDAARGDLPRATWLRNVALIAASAGMELPPGRPAWGSVHSQAGILVLATEEEAALIAAACGETPRSTWLRAAALAAAA